MIADSQGVQLNLFPFYWYRKRRLDFFFLTGKWPFLNLENVLFDGWAGWGGLGGLGGRQKCPSIFFILRGYIDHVYIYLYM